MICLNVHLGGFLQSLGGFPSHRVCFNTGYQPRLLTPTWILLLAMEKAGTTDTAEIAKAIWDVTTGEGKKTVYNVTDGLAAIRAGEEIN